jgi:hypothetical protein
MLPVVRTKATVKGTALLDHCGRINGTGRLLDPIPVLVGEVAAPDLHFKIPVVGTGFLHVNGLASFDPFGRNFLQTDGTDTFGPAQQFWL